MSNTAAQEGKAQNLRGGYHNSKVVAMPNEALVVHVPDPEKNKVLLVNEVRESRYSRVVSVGAPTGRYREAPIKVGDIVLTATPTAGVAVPGLFQENKQLHRLDWRDIQCIVEDYDHE